MAQIDWKVGDRAYIWYARDNHNARNLKGSIVVVELLEILFNKYKVKILLSGYNTKWARKGAVLYVTHDELYPNIIALTNKLESHYRDYLLSQTSRLVAHRDEIHDPS